MAIIGLVLGQTEAPEPLLPDSSVDIWSGIAVLTGIGLLLAVAAWLV